MSPEKMHDSIMNSIDSQLEFALGVGWLEFSGSVEYQMVSSGIWAICHGTETTEESD